MTQFAEECKKRNKAYKNRGRVIWRSCVLTEVPNPEYTLAKMQKKSTKGISEIVNIKQPLQGTRVLSPRPKGKLLKKRLKKQGHAERWGTTQ